MALAGKENKPLYMIKLHGARLLRSVYSPLPLSQLPIQASVSPPKAPYVPAPFTFPCLSIAASPPASAFDRKIFAVANLAGSSFEVVSVLKLALCLPSLSKPPSVRFFPFGFPPFKYWLEIYVGAVAPLALLGSEEAVPPVYSTAESFDCPPTPSGYDLLAPPL